MPAPWRDRVQHHARRFHEKDATTVLNRYEQQRRIMSRPQLEKHAFHVASWLVLPEVRRSHGDSVEALLSRYLESLDGQPLCERLKAVLSLVSASSGVAGLSGLLGKRQKRKVEMMQADEPEKPDSAKPVDACREKAVRLMQKASQTWQNHPSECREAYVESLEQEVQEADGAENSAKLRMVLRRAVAALSPPRRLGDGCEGKLLASHASNDQSTLATNLQSRLRKIVLRCLDRVDMADLRLAPVLQSLQSLLQTFQELVTSESTIACRRQWARLQAKCASTMPPEAGSSGVAGLSGLLGKGQKRKVEMMQADELGKPDSSKPVDACGEKALRLMQKASQMWQNHPSECREAYVESLEQEVQKADGAENSAKLRMVLRRAVAALSPPRRLGDGCEGKTPSIACNDQSLATNLQTRLRKIVLHCLDRVDLADVRLAPLLQCLQSLLRTFQELVTGESRIACKKQWARLQVKCASTMPPEAAASLSACAKGAEDGAGIAEGLGGAEAAGFASREAGPWAGLRGSVAGYVSEIWPADAQKAGSEFSLLGSKSEAGRRSGAEFMVQLLDNCDARKPSSHPACGISVLRGMASALFTIGLDNELAAMPAPWRDRVQHHARRFQEKDATTVLNRYEQQRRIMSRPQLEKHAFHVACWLVLPEVRRSHGDSVEALLSRYLESLDAQPVCERLKAVLSLVSTSSGVAGLSGLLGEGQKRKAEMMQADGLEKTDSSKPVDACVDKAVRLMQKASQTWQNHPSECREAYVESLEQEMHEADGAENSAKLRMVLRRAVAALSPPRRLGDGCEGKSIASNDQATLATNLQSRLRKVVLRCLDRVDMADLRLAPVQQCLQSLLHTFQLLVTSQMKARLVRLLKYPRRSEPWKSDEASLRSGERCLAEFCDKTRVLAQKGPNLPYASVLPPGQESGVESIVQLLDNCDARKASETPEIELLTLESKRTSSKGWMAECDETRVATFEKDATTVLNRYEQQRRIMSRPQLEKHAFHVACWLVLPEAEMIQADELEKPDSSKPVDACVDKAVRLMQKASQTWQNHPSECREAYVDSLEQEVQEANGAENSAKLRMVLRRAVAALSPPRRLGDGCEGKMPASVSSNDQATLATNLQSRLRKSVLRCLDRVDLADVRLAPVLQCLQSLLQTFQDQLEDSVAGYVSEIRPADTSMASSTRSHARLVSAYRCRPQWPKRADDPPESS
ncbi:unnamed protein product [Effrenium voratum]|uniref:Uncharacterized protein n=1 Tax=Effrenium voratum TaxID=2562239 RepID=A0AA36JQ99_9DINO|nr:unnamed protein product [Effrenium voratum]